MTSLDRKRAGRPKADHDLVKISLGYRLPRWLVESMRAYAMPASVLIEVALCAYTG